MYIRVVAPFHLPFSFPSSLPSLPTVEISIKMLRPTFIALLPLLAASASSLSPSQVCSSLAVTLGVGSVYLAGQCGSGSQRENNVSLMRRYTLGTSQYVDQTTSKATESAEMSPACVVEPQVGAVQKSLRRYA